MRDHVGLILDAREACRVTRKDPRLAQAAVDHLSARVNKALLVWRQDDLAAAVGYAPRTLSFWADGNWRKP